MSLFLNKNKVKEIITLSKLSGLDFIFLSRELDFWSPKARKYNFYRGEDLNIYDNETRIALKNLKNIFDTNLLENIWKKCLESKYIKYLEADSYITWESAFFNFKLYFTNIFS